MKNPKTRSNYAVGMCLKKCTNRGKKCTNCVQFSNQEPKDEKKV